MRVPHHLLEGQGELSAGGGQGLFLRCIWAFRNQLIKADAALEGRYLCTTQACCGL